MCTARRTRDTSPRQADFSFTRHGLLFFPNILVELRSAVRLKVESTFIFVADVLYDCARGVIPVTGVIRNMSSAFRTSRESAEA